MKSFTIKENVKKNLEAHAPIAQRHIHPKCNKLIFDEANFILNLPLKLKKHSKVTFLKCDLLFIISRKKKLLYTTIRRHLFLQKMS